jgi:hypothetical protein
MWMFLATGSLLGVTTEAIREGLASGTSAEAQTLGERVIEANRDVD